MWKLSSRVEISNSGRHREHNLDELLTSQMQHATKVGLLKSYVMKY